jgi:hypothetical protein
MNFFPFIEFFHLLSMRKLTEPNQKCHLLSQHKNFMCAIQLSQLATLDINFECIAWDFKQKG